MGSSKKRKERPPNRTLMDFFSSADVVKRARMRTSGQLASNQPETVAPREIIVIDSDSDGPAYGKEDEFDPGIGVSEDPQPPSPVASTLTYSENKDGFGVPSALLQPPNLRVGALNQEFHAQQQPAHTPKHHLESMFGVSAPLLEQPLIRSQLPERSQVLHENVCAVVGGNSAADGSSVEFSIGEWAVGDDELLTPEILDNGAEIVEDARGRPSDKQHICPVCGMGFTGVSAAEAQAHANQCLDTAATQSGQLITASVKSNFTSNEDGSNELIKGQGCDLFTVLMNSRKEKEVWVEADVPANSGFRLAGGNRRKAPFYKVLQGMPIAVDAFCYGAIPGVTAYFLTHAHSDHYTSLGSKWKSGPIYCSEETANLILHMLSVNPRWIHPLPLDTPTIIPNTGGVSVTLIEANHCPGSCLFLFEGCQTIDAGDGTFKSLFIGSTKIFRYLHCGDFRASPRHVLHPAVNGKRIDHIYLDTTYLDPKYTFSPQPLVISACAGLAQKLVMGGVEGEPNVLAHQNLTIDAWMKSATSAKSGGEQMVQERILVIVGTYSIGKERIVKAIAQALGTKIYCDSRKTAILRCQADKELHALLTADPAEANVHILPLGTVTLENLRSYLQKFKGTFSRVIGFRPTGWAYSPPPGHDLNGSIQSVITCGQSQHFSYTDLQPSQKSSHNVQIFGVPYSEHSSFFELTCFAMSCDWGSMIPTVNMGSPTARAKMTMWLKRWKLEKGSTKSLTVPPRAADYW